MVAKVRIMARDVSEKSDGTEQIATRGLIPLRKAAKQLGRGVHQVRRMIRQGRIQAFNDCGRYYFTQEQIDAYLKGLK